MTERNNHQDLSIIERYLRYKYWFIGSAIFFLLITFIYLSFQPKQYQVSGKFIITGNTLSADDLRSKATVQKVLSQLPLQVSYFQNDTEMYSNTIPLKIVLLSPNIDTAAQLTASVVDEQVVKVTQNDTISYYYFNKPVNDYRFAKFKVVKGPNFHSRESIIPVVVKFNDPDRQLEEYYKNFDVKSVGDDNRYLALSIITASPEKGIDFFNKLVQVSNDRSIAANVQYSPAQSAINPESDKLQSDIAALKDKYRLLKDREAELKSNKDGRPAVVGGKKLSNLQLQILDAIQPYVKSPVNQFVQIPDSYQVSDANLEQLIVDFNKIEIQKQRILRDSEANSAKITSLNEQIAILKTSILNKIDINKKEANGTSPVAPINATSLSYAALHDSMSMIDKQMKAAQRSYSKLSKNNAVKINSTQFTPRLVIVENSIETAAYPSSGLIYFFALLAGLTVPFAFFYLKYLIYKLPNIRIGNVIDIKKAGDWISELTQVKEID